MDNIRMSSDLERMRALAKSLAVMEDAVVAVYRKRDGTYGFDVADRVREEIIEYITPY